jgi:hypothetical protein
MANKEVAKTNQKRKPDETNIEDDRPAKRVVAIKYKPSTTKSAEHP